MKARNFLVVVLLTLLSTDVLAIVNKKFCIWDPVGKNGPVMTFYNDVIPRAQTWGVNIEFIPFTDEKVAARWFREGLCEAVLLSAILSRDFVKFGGTMDAIGGIRTQRGLESVLKTLTNEKASRLMLSENGRYEVIATFPVGSMFAFVNDRKIDHITKFAGKRMSILNGDPQARRFADKAGATPVNTTLTTFASQFNNGNIDILLMPALAYNTFELYKGLGNKGGIIKYKMYYGMLQTIAKPNEFPDVYDKELKETIPFGRKMRLYMLRHRLQAMKKMIEDAEAEIPERYWIHPGLRTEDYIKQFSKEIRIELRQQDLNHPVALKLFWKIRCGIEDPTNGECARDQRRNNPEFAKIKKDPKKTRY